MAPSSKAAPFTKTAVLSPLSISVIFNFESFMLQLAVEALNANPGDKKEYWVNARTDSEGKYTSPLTPGDFTAGILIVWHYFQNYF